MIEQPPQNRTMNATEVRANWSKLLLDVFNHRSRLVVQKGGIPIAAIISVDDLKRFQRIESERAERDAFRVSANHCVFSNQSATAISRTDQYIAAPDDQLL